MPALIAPRYFLGQRLERLSVSLHIASADSLWTLEQNRLPLTTGSKVGSDCIKTPTSK